MKTSENLSDKKPTEEISAKEKLKATLNSCLHKFADYLRRQSEKLSLPQKKLALALFGLLMGGICLILTIRPFYNSSAIEFNLPQGMNKAFVIPPVEQKAMFSEEDYLLLMKFKATLDSLYKTDRPAYDELLRGRESLLDSINFLISIY